MGAQRFGRIGKTIADMHNNICGTIFFAPQGGYTIGREADEKDLRPCDPFFRTATLFSERLSGFPFSPSHCVWPIASHKSGATIVNPLEFVSGMAAFSTAAKAAISAAKDILSISGEFDKAELKLKAVELMNQVVKLAEENSSLHHRLIALNEQLNIKSELTLIGEVYFRKLPDGGKDGPFCTRCYEAEGKLIRLPASATRIRTCPQCHGGKHPR
jgi:hypothetical protein